MAGDVTYVQVMASSKILSVAIDFGTTFSGYAFSFKHEKDRVYTYQWESERGEASNPKTPTSVLFDPHKSFDSFGYQAERKYASLSEIGQSKNWYFFKKFKMTLFKDKNINQWTLIKDYCDKEMQALVVFSACIKYLKDHLLRNFSHVIGNNVDTDIHWVLTVPAIWTDAAKQFMRQAAVKAGIQDDQLSLALEPEAAALWCKSTQGLTQYELGSQFMVVDCGGGTVDITVHQVQADGKLKERHAPSGGAWGGVKVDDAFQEFLLENYGMGAIRCMTKQDVLQLDQDFESFKKTINPHELSMLYSVKLPNSIRSHIQLSGKARLVGDKLRIPASTVIKFFDFPVKKIKERIQQMMQDPNVRNTSRMYLVGGFSESKVLQDCITKLFSNFILQVYIPPDATSTVLKGAVLFGHNPNIIGWRIATHTYGVQICTHFDYQRHNISKKIIIEGEEHCNDIFDTFVHKGETIENQHKTPVQTLCPLITGMTQMEIPIYTSTDRYPFYTTDYGCRLLGSMTVLMPDTTGEKTRKVKVQMEFGGTELKVLATDGNTGKRFTSSFDFV